jgi:two-component system chemotaxis sensor kinase CheA
VVDALEGTQRTVVKPLGPVCRGAVGVSGAALVGDGGVALILDIPSLFRATLRRVSPSPDPGAVS